MLQLQLRLFMPFRTLNKLKKNPQLLSSCGDSTLPFWTRASTFSGSSIRNAAATAAQHHHLLEASRISPRSGTLWNQTSFLNWPESFFFCFIVAFFFTNCLLAISALIFTRRLRRRRATVQSVWISRHTLYIRIHNVCYVLLWFASASSSSSSLTSSASSTC